MPFIAELMPEEAKENLPFNVSAAYDGSRPSLWKWAVDTQNSAYIVLVNVHGGGYSGTEQDNVYILNWQGSLCSITASPQQRTFTENGVVMHWKIKTIDLHKDSPLTPVEILPILTSAFKAIGDLFNGEEFQDVLVTFPPLEAVTVNRLYWDDFERP